jgi:hypothetical protein
MAGCGSKKMAKGGMVKMSPRKAMAMGKKPSGAKTKVKKFAMGGLASAAPTAGTGLKGMGSAPTTQQQMQNMGNAAAAAKAQAAGFTPMQRADFAAQQANIRELRQNRENSKLFPGLSRENVKPSIKNLKSALQTQMRGLNPPSFAKGGSVKKK